MASKGIASVCLITSPADDPESMTSLLAWMIPAGWSDAFAREMTGRFGAPVAESVATVAALIRSSDRGAEDGVVTTVFAERPGKEPPNPT